MTQCQVCGQKDLPCCSKDNIGLPKDKLCYNGICDPTIDICTNTSGELHAPCISKTDCDSDFSGLDCVRRTDGYPGKWCDCSAENGLACGPSEVCGAKKSKKPGAESCLKADSDGSTLMADCSTQIQDSDAGKYTVCMEINKNGSIDYKCPSDYFKGNDKLQCEKVNQCHFMIKDGKAKPIASLTE